MGTEERGPPPPAGGKDGFEALASLTTFGVALLAPDGTVRSFGSGQAVVLGHPLAELTGRPILDLVHPDDQPLVRRAFADLTARPGIDRSAELRVRQADGTWRWIDAAATSLGTDAVTAVAVIGRDVTAHRRDHELLRAEAARLRALVAHTRDVLVVRDQAGRVSFVSASVEARLGWTVEEFTRHADRLTHPDDEPPTVRFRHRDGSWRWMDVATIDLRYDPRVAGTFQTLRDVTEQVGSRADLARREGELKENESRYRTLLGNALDVVQVSGVDGTIEWVSPSVRDVLGYRPADAVGHHIREIVHPEDVEVAADAYREVLADLGATRRLAVRLRSASGEWRWVDARLVNRLDDPDHPGVVITYLDTTERELALRDARRLTALADSSTDLIFISEPDGTVVYANDSVRRFLGVSDEGDIERFDPAAHLTEGDQRVFQESVLASLRQRGSWQGELTAIDHAGRPVAVEAEVIVHHDRRGRVDVLSCIARDVSDRKVLEASLAHQATHDPLTGLPNRTLFFDRLEVAVRRAERSHRYPAVLFLDLDHFKVVNDSLGHSLGDQLLVELADRLTKAIRPGDTVGRFGGDEFVVLCEDLHEEREAVIVADRVAGVMNTPVVIDDSEIFVSASIGIAYAGDPQTAEELLRDADAAMYEAKERGRARTEVFDSGMRTRAVDRLALESDLRHAVERDELRVHYQPLISLATGRVTGVEALLRWEHPQRGLLLPGDFLTIAEEGHTIVPIGRWLAAEACRTVDRLQVALPHLEPLVLSINLSADQLAHPELLEDLRTALRDGNLEPGQVDLDLTEEVLTADLDLTDRRLSDLKAFGVRLAVDDFGRGFSSLGFFRHLPVDLLKVDHDFVAALGRSAGDASVVAAVVELAHSLGLQAIAEGVETAGQLTELRRLGCDMAQGYFIAHPLPAAELTELLATDPVWWIFEGGLRSGVWSGWVRAEGTDTIETTQTAEATETSETTETTEATEATEATDSQ